MGEVREGATLRLHGHAGTSTWQILQGLRGGFGPLLEPVGCLQQSIGLYRLFFRLSKSDIDAITIDQIANLQDCQPENAQSFREFGIEPIANGLDEKFRQLALSLGS